jgi:O-antigen/teichoic acid export membrane protein
LRPRGVLIISAGDEAEIRTFMSIRLFRRRDHQPGQTRSILRNAAYILAGKGFGGLLSLGYVAFAARTLGVEGFGSFVLILAFGQGVAGLAQFQTADILIRFGAIHLASRAHERLARLIGFGAMLDALSAGMAIVLALFLALWLGPRFGLSAGDSRRAALFAASFVFVLRGTPVGILRLFNRFDLAALIESLIPAVRLAAAAIGFALDRSVDLLLVAWALAELLATFFMWAAALREVRRHSDLPLRRELGHWRRAPSENDRLWSFAGFTNLSSSVGFLRQQAGTLLVGWQAGAGAAGTYRFAQQLAQAISKPVVALSRAVYPDLAHVAASGGAEAVARLSRRLSFMGAALGLAATAIVAFAGPWILSVVAGPSFASGAPVFLILTAAAAVELWAFGQEPALMALGRAGTVLAVRAASGVLTIVLMLLLLERFGGTGAAWAVLIGNGVTRLAMGLTLSHFTRRANPQPASTTAADALTASED